MSCVQWGKELQDVLALVVVRPDHRNYCDTVEDRQHMEAQKKCANQAA